MKKEWFLSFLYNTETGRGDLDMHNDSLLGYQGKARTGSIKAGVGLIKAITPGVWSIHSSDPPELTNEPGMTWEGELGWKARMRTPKNNWSRFLIHPDGDGKGEGNKGNGTRGCIGIQGSGELLYIELHQILKIQDIIRVYINTPYPEDGHV